jgi:ElaB/YqjD/DUF883 family membrane-anchored ribosome-binding protein
MKADTERLENDLRQVVNDAENLIAEVAATTGNGIDEVRDRIEDRLHSAKATLEEAKEAITERARHAATATEEYVEGHMWQSLAVAAAVGVVIGMLIRRH